MLVGCIGIGILLTSDRDAVILHECVACCGHLYFQSETVFVVIYRFISGIGLIYLISVYIIAVAFGIRIIQ